jgi:hypothetical protein
MNHSHDSPSGIKTDFDLHIYTKLKKKKKEIIVKNN